jgi:hypothetical protein
MSKIDYLIEKKYKFIIILFFAFYLFLGLCIFKDYGISWDESAQRKIGAMATKYIVYQDPALLTHHDKYHGPIFEIVLYAVEKILDISENWRIVYLTRHLLTFLLFYTSTIFFFFLMYKYIFKNWKISMLGTLFLILSPRIFADSFYNSKDIAFLAMFIISIFTLIGYLEKKTPFSAIMHAFTCAVLVDIRVLGILLPFLTFVFLAADMLFLKPKRIKVKKSILSFIIYVLLLIPLTVLFWPTLWEAPLYHFAASLRLMSHYNRGINRELFLGRFIEFIRPPWYYIPAWMIITTPLLYILGFLMGCFVLVKSLLKSPMQFYIDNRNSLILILWFFFPLTVVILIKSVVYNGWRHMFFVYPGFLLISLTGLTYLFRYLKMRFRGLGFRFMNASFIFLVTLSLINVSRITIKSHPFQNVYFNILAGIDKKRVEQNFILDYWGLSYRRGLEYILRNDKSPVIKIQVANFPGRINAYILPSQERDRLIYVEKSGEAQYFLSNYRGKMGEYPFKDEYYSVDIEGLKILAVYKLNHNY